MARTKSQTVELVEDAPLAGDLNVKLNALTEHRIQVMAQFGDSLPYERDRIVHEARFYMVQSAEAMLEAGKRLVILKENEPHGEFIEIVENSLGIATRIAQKMMQASLKFLSPTLASNAKALSHLGKTKLYELMLEDDEDLAELADGGTVAGMTLDDIGRMTCRELKAALREARETNTAQQRVLTDKNQKIDDLTTKLDKKSRIQPPPPDQEAEKLRKEVSAIAYEAEAAITVRLHTAFSTLTAFTSDNNVEPPYDFMAGLVCQIERALHHIRDVFDLEAAPTGSERPTWLDAPEPAIPRTDA
ncbi:conserved hypothetical phage-related protein [Pectobacterium atrosepticum SCRI1043]|uniref:Conserved hypothetical phage-related protein n=1 Tax=Pectobacterium atrosepticum (strain SCRI 1043 / ATCC BAA-672) TaxID=218491 RepID=Q6D0U4_PECAS|nr:DUF3102 domain-containing protein [Pectobacterium atrosepticum]AIA72725.1 hypothetical protein EV46_19610 [Pectobacterium atrosepticum]AIK15708.1 hypothetical protein GZ59_39970 [Pectobacterium atrosepticum]MCL6317821.1 DUF3102 domain-containing protein [Pectobacterium atrosepticum]MCL6322286.1 DUF3102 domain-containing protein [Pectobacterium atrosepticum]POW25422.1 phage protein [Pectobacterium atrosepticum]